ncbi:hypothetical protein LR48_Vigan86s000400 [Vigna angularis]|uniref:Uncharacterized protein n=1 Tax=Phaseolus angularis TaxID=3914 RepID=A0A0L9T3V3_PHAAN|nr:hypothetical protein LR48_Vigan86s000400 [Vigna angularis]
MTTFLPLPRRDHLARPQSPSSCLSSIDSSSAPHHRTTFLLHRVTQKRDLSRQDTTPLCHQLLPCITIITQSRQYQHNQHHYEINSTSSLHLRAPWEPASKPNLKEKKPNNPAVRDSGVGSPFPNLKP